jgi:hypothetical protein
LASAEFAVLSLRINKINKKLKVAIESLLVRHISQVIDVYVSSATKAEILKNPIQSLNSKDYNKKKLNVSANYKLVKLGDICKCLSTTKHYTSIGKLEGLYKFSSL